MHRTTTNYSNLSIYFSLLIFCFFPFLNLLQLPIDSQPNALIVATIILIINPRFVLYRIPLNLTLLFLIFVIATILLFSSEFTFESFTSYTSYISLIIVPLSVYIALVKQNGLSYKLFYRVVLIWSFVAFIQKFFLPEFLSFLQFRSSGSGLTGRGVTSLAPEPTYFGTVITLFIIIYFLNSFNKKSKLLLWVLIIDLIFFSISSTIIAVILFSTFIYYFVDFLRFRFTTTRIIILSSVLVIIFILVFLLESIEPDIRLFKILSIVFSTPELILLDESINERLNHALFPVISLYDNYLLPGGYNNFNKYIILKSHQESYYIFFENLNIDHYKKIMSGFGASIFELGIFGLLIPLFIYSLLSKYLKSDKVRYLYILLNVLLFTSISLNNGLILFVFGNIIYLTRKRHLVDFEK